MSTISLQSALEIVQKAVILDNNGKAQEAISMYSIAIDHLRQVSNGPGIELSTKNLIDSKILEYQNRSNFLKSSLHLDYSNNNNINNSNNNISPPPQPLLNNSNGINNNGSTNLVDEALKYANEAVSCESKNNFSNAIIYYRKCSELLEQASKNESDIETRLFLNQKKQEYHSRAETLEIQYPQQQQQQRQQQYSNNSSGMMMMNNSNSNLQFSKNNLPFPQAEQEYSIMNSIEQVNNTNDLIDAAIDSVKEAIKEDDHLNYEKAIYYYDLSVQYFQTALNNGAGNDSPQVKQLINEKLVNSKSRSQFLKNKIQYKQTKINDEFDAIPLSLKPGQKYKDPVRKKTVLERLSKTIKGPKNISDHWL